MKRLTLAEARKQIKDRELWLWRQEHWGSGPYGDYCDEDYPGTGLEAMFWEIPNLH